VPGNQNPFPWDERQGLGIDFVFAGRKKRIQTELGNISAYHPTAQVRSALDPCNNAIQLRQPILWQQKTLGCHPHTGRTQGTFIGSWQESGKVHVLCGLQKSDGFGSRGGLPLRFQ